MKRRGRRDGRHDGDTWTREARAAAFGLRTDIQEALRQMVAERGLKQRELAKRLGVSGAAISATLSADTFNPTLRTLGALLHEMDAQIDVSVVDGQLLIMTAPEKRIRLMLPEDLPPCICHTHDYDAGSAHISPALQQQWFTCRVCKARLTFISMGMCNMLLFNDTETDHDYINRVVFSAWRTWSAEAEKARHEIRTRLRHQVNVELGLPVDTKGYDAPEHARSAWHKRLDALDDAHRLEISLPPGLRPPPLPPRMPDHMIVFVGVHGPTGHGWRRVTPAETRDLPMPPDPIRVHHDERFGAIFKRLELSVTPIEIPNRYYKDIYNREPWYTFPMGTGNVIIGPRKRVVAISATRFSPFNATALRDIAKEDGVTWEADGKWQGQDARILEGEIHAYTDDKVIEYAQLLFEALRGT